MQISDTYKDTKMWLDWLKIKNYTIQDDLSVDIDGDLMIASRSLKYLGVQFGHVSGHCSIARNSLASLKGSPKKVEGVFTCSNNKLKSLEFCPNEVNKSFFCKNNLIANFDHLPIHVGGGIGVDNLPLFNNELDDFLASKIYNEDTTENDLHVPWTTFKTFILKKNLENQLSFKKTNFPKIKI